MQKEYTIEQITVINKYAITGIIALLNTEKLQIFSVDLPTGNNATPKRREILQSLGTVENDHPKMYMKVLIPTKQKHLTIVVNYCITLTGDQ